MMFSLTSNTPSSRSPSSRYSYIQTIGYLIIYNNDVNLFIFVSSIRVVRTKKKEKGEGDAENVSQVLHKIFLI